MIGAPTSVSQPGSGWRWGVVAIGADGVSRSSPLQRGNASIDVATRADDRGVYLVVVGAPTAHHKIRHNQPYFSIYRYPWMVQLTNATPQEAPRPTGRTHANGGGFVAQGATVDASAYVGPQARVLGGVVRQKARIEGRATVLGGTIEGSARVIGVSLVQGNPYIADNAVVNTTFRGVGAFLPNPRIVGTAKVHGDLELWATQLDRGAWYGFVDNSTAGNATMLGQANPVTEVTRRPTTADLQAPIGT